MVAAHAAAQSAEDRRSLGSHATPPALARTLVELALDQLGRIPELVVDPSCGAGSFLLAAADALVGRGVAPTDVLGRLAGCDVDPEAVRRCRQALDRWAAGHGAATWAQGGLTGAAGETISAPNEHLGSAATVIQLDPLRAATPFTDRADLVVGNPPFLAQRTSDTARSAEVRDALKDRFGVLGSYADDAAVFLLVASELLAPDAVMVLIEPQSMLSARDSAVVRSRVLGECDLVALWADDVRYFEADVDVCAPLLRRRDHRGGAPADAPAERPTVELHWGAAGALVGRAAAPSTESSWAPLLAASMGVPNVVDPAVDPAQVAPSSSSNPAGTLADVATVTAGFRDEFYAMAAAALVAGDDGWSDAADQLVTVGMIDVCRLDVESPRRLGGRRVSAPRLDADAVQRDAPKVARWVQARRVPKVVVATQTKVIEAVADPFGAIIPVTPVLSVEPLPASSQLEPLDVWHLLAALSAPPLAAMVARSHAGSGLSMRSFRVSAATLRALPLPRDRSAWAEGAVIARAAQQAQVAQHEPLDERVSSVAMPLLESLGAVMIRAYGEPDDVLLAWWLGLVTGRSR